MDVHESQVTRNLVELHERHFLEQLLAYRGQCTHCIPGFTTLFLVTLKNTALRNNPSGALEPGLDLSRRPLTMHHGLRQLQGVPQVVFGG